MLRPSPSVLALVLPLLALAPAIAGPALAAPSDPEPTTELERLDVSMNRARDLIRNASMKMKNGVVSGMRQSDGSAPDTPAERCCAGNLEGLQKSYLKIAESLERLDACYESRGISGESADMLELSVEDLATLARVTGNFAQARDMRTAGGSLAAMQRAFLLLKKSRDGLFEDCPLTGQ